MTVEEALRFFDELQLRGSAKEIASEVLKEVRARLDFLSSVGLGYLSLQHIVAMELAAPENGYRGIDGLFRQRFLLCERFLECFGHDHTEKSRRTCPAFVRVRFPFFIEGFPFTST